jgi:ABC-type cobalamin/Fe3+-siderophores transport system ATPase subunit
MYIERLHVKNVRLLAEQDFSFVNPDGSPRLWTVIVGENGVCKSTILQTIALTAMGPKLGSALVENAQRLRKVSNSEAASITATFTPVRGRKHLVSSLRIEPDRFDLIPGDEAEGARFLDELRAYRFAEGFVAGYGVGRFLAEPGEAVLPRDPVLERVKGLFNVRHRMLGLNFYDAFDKRQSSRFSRVLHQILEIGGTPEERLLPGFCDINLGSSRSNQSRMFERGLFELWIDDRKLEIPTSWLSDGYQATLSWIAELLGYSILDREENVNPRITDFLSHYRKPKENFNPKEEEEKEEKNVDPTELEGIVLLDEIDLHLHPTWQRRIVPLLRKAFPRLQFIVSTHSPLVLAGFEREEIILLKLQDGQVVQDTAEIEPGVLTASEILTNFFDVQRAGRPDLVSKERRYLELRGLKRPSASECRELEELGKELDPYWASGPSTAELLSPEEILKRKA